MQGMLVETLVITFVFGGILGAITALHLASPKEQSIHHKDQSKMPHKHK
jgi:hypothetical protein